jgi:hypothetical protein
MLHYSGCKKAVHRRRVHFLVALAWSLSFLVIAHKRLQKPGAERLATGKHRLPARQGSAAQAWRILARKGVSIILMPSQITF